VKSPIHNFKRQQKRRVVFNLRIAYTTSPDVLREVPRIIEEIISTKESIVFDRSHLQNLADTFINFETVYTVSTADYALYMNTQQQIYLEILEAFKARNIEIALPMQNIIIEGRLEQQVKQLPEKKVEMTEPTDGAINKKSERDII
jgi:small-conductance mechanosensitive channel